MTEKTIHIISLHTNMIHSLYCLLILFATGCKQRYEAPVQSQATGYLVVDGVINSGPGTAGLALSRSTKFDDKEKAFETGASVSVQGTDSSIFILGEKGQGFYSADNLTFNKHFKYRLLINTASGENYHSDFVVVKNDPPIDSISWVRQSDGVQLYINTLDAQNNSIYYQWYYDEAWQFHSAYLNYLKFTTTVTNDGIKYGVGYKDSTTFSYDTSIIKCWQFYAPLNIFLSSTAKLSKDVVAQPLVFIPNASIRLGVLYSIHLKQYTWTAEGYEFMERMRKNTEATGTVFDAQPSELVSNIHNVDDASEQVIGFFNICPIQEKRIFINNRDVPGWNYDSHCTDVVLLNSSSLIAPYFSGYIPTTVETGVGLILSFRAAIYTCVDCTATGSNKKPSYWP